MADYIDRENYCKSICRCSRDKCDKDKCPLWAAPAADVEPVGRCGECALKDTFDCICSKNGYTDKIMEYCSFFASKEGEENG